MLAISVRLAAAIHGFLAFYMPTNRAVGWLRSPSGIKWAIPVAIAATPAYLFALNVCMTVIERGGRGYLNVQVALFAWNAIKFAVVGALTPFHWLGLLRRDHRRMGSGVAVSAWSSACVQTARKGLARAFVAS